MPRSNAEKLPDISADKDLYPPGMQISDSLPSAPRLPDMEEIGRDLSPAAKDQPSPATTTTTTTIDVTPAPTKGKTLTNASSTSSLGPRRGVPVETQVDERLDEMFLNKNKGKGSEKTPLVDSDIPVGNSRPDTETVPPEFSDHPDAPNESVPASPDVDASTARVGSPDLQQEAASPIVSPRVEVASPLPPGDDQIPAAFADEPEPPIERGPPPPIPPVNIDPASPRMEDPTSVAAVTLEDTPRASLSVDHEAVPAEPERSPRGTPPPIPPLPEPTPPPAASDPSKSDGGVSLEDAVADLEDEATNTEPTPLYDPTSIPPPPVGDDEAGKANSDHPGDRSDD